MIDARDSIAHCWAWSRKGRTVATLDIRGVTKAFGTLPVLHGIDIAVRDGEFLVLVGPSGCGKSTLLRMIAGLESVTGGDIAIGGNRVNDLAPRDRNIAMVFQDYALYPHKTVAENIGFGLKVRKTDPAEIKRRVDDAAQILQIDHLLERRPGQLSGGQRQRVAMGRAIVRDPQVFLFDEPLSNLDAQLRAEMRLEIKKLHQRLNNTIVYVTHDQVEAMTLADRIAVMRAGHVEQLGTPDEIYNHPTSRFVAGFTGSPPMNTAPCTISDNGQSLSLDGGISLPVPAATAAKLAALAGKRATFGIRPEHLALAPGNDGLESTVILTEPLGAETLALLKIGNAELTGRFSPDSALAPGQTISLTVNMARMHLFDTDSGKALL
jgi:multiple sugar transport system ATP-binding protein